MNESIPIDWDTKIKDILPESLWALQDPIAQDHADLVDILSHRTGLPRHDLSYSLTDTLESSVSINQFSHLNAMMCMSILLIN